MDDCPMREHGPEPAGPFHTGVMAGVVKGITELGHWELFQCGVGIAGGILVYGAVNIVMKNELMLAGLERFREWARRG